MNTHLNIIRYKQIITIFTKHGFGFLIDQLGILNYLKIKRNFLKAHNNSRDTKLSTGERLRMACEELGPTFVKLGQILSTRSDVFSADIIEELKKLQDSVPPFHFDEVRGVIESEFNDKLENIYKEFDDKPLAAASISQVHHARLKSGKEVVVKIQRPGIEKNIHSDLNILKDLANFLDHHTEYGELYNLGSMVNEFDHTLKNELDFTREAENADIFKQNLLKDEGIKVPEIEWNYTTRRVLTMECIQGIRIDNFQELDKANIDREALAKKLAASILNQIVRDGFFHADPHPGNILILHDGTIVFLDLGMVGRLSEKRKRTLSNMFIGVASKNSRIVVKAIVDLDSMPNSVNLRNFENEIDKMLDRYLSLPLKEINIGELLLQLFKLAFSYRLKIPSEFTFIAKALITVQGLVEKLDRNLNILVIAKPIAHKLLYQSFSLKNITEDVKRDLLDYKDLIEEFPAYILNLLRKVEDDNLTVQFEIKNIERIQRRFDRVFNRISFCVILLSVSIIIAGIIIGAGLSASSGNEMYLLNIRVLKIGLTFACIIIAGLLVSMIRSDRF